MRTCLLLFAAALIFCNASAHPVLVKETIYKGSIVIRKTTYGKRHHVKIYAGLRQEKLLFSASGTHGRNYQLFVFDINGGLVKQSRIQDKQTAVVTEIQKGNYLFELFNDDLRIENGSIVIK